jgi:hypothetical protein
MNVQFTDQPAVYDVSGSELRIHWNIEEKTQEGMGGETQTYWQADEALCAVMDSRATLIEKIIAAVYSTGAEIAAINNQEINPEGYAQYQAFRVQAKALADGWLAL